MVHIPPGTYEVGLENGDGSHAPRQAVQLPGYWIDALPATNAQYRAFLAASGRSAPTIWKDGAYPVGQDARPVEGLSWNDAQAYCTALAKRLPSEAEWEVAARGPGADPPLYPWGSDPTAGGAYAALPPTRTYDAGSAPFNVSRFGVFDMAGTVWQWVGETYAPVAAGYQVLRGGRHGYLEDMAFRQQAQPDDARFQRFAGVRCAASQIAGE